jgi:hypothetical protein
VISLALGALATWLLAWILIYPPGTGFYREWRLEGWYVDPEGNHVDMRVEAISGPGWRDGLHDFTAGDPGSCERMWKAMREGTIGPYCTVETSFHKFGFPFYSMAYRSVSTSSKPPSYEGNTTHVVYETYDVFTVRRKLAEQIGFPWLPYGGGGYHFPKGILLRGFLLDTLFWGIPIFGLIYGRGMVRRRRRRKLGLCLGCAYDLRGNVSGICPECGESI